MRFVNGRLALVGLAVCAGLAVGGTALAGGSAQPGEDPEQPEGPVTSVVNSDVREEDVPLDSPLVRAVKAALPGSPEVHRAVHRQEVDVDDPRDVNTGLDYFSLSSVVNGAGYEISVYRHFDPAEMEAFQLPRQQLAGGTLWIGSDGITGDNVYYLATNGVAVFISLIGEDATAGTAEELGAIAVHLTGDPTIREAAA